MSSHISWWPTWSDLSIPRWNFLTIHLVSSVFVEAYLSVVTSSRLWSFRQIFSILNRKLPVLIIAKLTIVPIYGTVNSNRSLHFIFASKWRTISCNLLVVLLLIYVTHTLCIALSTRMEMRCFPLLIRDRHSYSIRVTSIDTNLRSSIINSSQQIWLLEATSILQLAKTC